VPADVLVAGDYLLLLKGHEPDGCVEDEAEYAFRVRRVE